MSLTPHIVPDERTDAEKQAYSYSWKAIRNAVIFAVVAQIRINGGNPLFITRSDFRRRFKENVSSLLLECSEDMRVQCEDLLDYYDTSVYDSFYDQYRELSLEMERQRKEEREKMKILNSFL